MKIRKESEKTVNKKAQKMMVKTTLSVSASRYIQMD